MIIIFTHVVHPYFRPSVLLSIRPHLSISRKPEQFHQVLIGVATGGTVGLAEWIIDDTSLIAFAFIGQITSPQERRGIGMVKFVIIFLNLVAVGIHLATYFMPEEHWPLMIYIRNQFSGLSLLCCCIQILDFLSFHHLFGPWAIIISSLMIDLGKFLTILMLFLFGFSMFFVAMNQPYYALNEMSESLETTEELLTINQG